MLDSFNNELFYDTYRSMTTSCMHPIYIGRKQDSIWLDYNIKGMGNRSTLDYYSPDSNDLILYIDSTQIIGSVIKNRSVIPPPGYIVETSSQYNLNAMHERGNTKAYPVFIKNVSQDSLVIGYGDYVPVIVEAEDSLGIWRPVQKPYYYDCGYGLSYFYLRPEEIIITSCKLFKGNYSTKMRLVFGANRKIKSNTFNGSIYYDQFNYIDY